MNTKKKNTNEDTRPLITIIGIVQDTYETSHVFKRPLPKNYFEDLIPTLPSHVLKECKKLENSWSDVKGNIHFSKDFSPEPYIGPDNKVYLLLGNLTLNNKKKMTDLMVKGTKLLEQIEVGIVSNE